MKPLRLAAVSIDLDDIDCYHAIHGLPATSQAPSHAVYDRALPRFEAFFKEADIRATFFAIGRDLARGSNAEALRRLHQQGHEIGNHSFSHAYDLSRKHNDAIEADIVNGMDAISKITGAKPAGFRAPGYTINDRVYLLLAKHGVLYDSSVFPCPWYYAAKAAALGWYWCRRRVSRSILDTPWMLTAPANPYRVGEPFWQRGQGLLELPIGVTGALSGRLPYIGTSLILAGPRGCRFLTRRIIGRPLVNLELHGIDLVDADADGIAHLKPMQPDLRKSLEHKRHCIWTAIEELKRAGYQFCTLQEAAQAFHST